jgi:hypothetical protein
VIYAFPQYFTSKSRFLTYHLVASVLRKAGHTITDDVDHCDAVLVSMCDVMDYPQLVKLRRMTKRPIIVGGHYAFNYWSAKLYSDFVWIGEIWDFAKCKTLDEIGESKHCYTGMAKQLFASQYIDWASIPVGQIAPKKCYYLGGVGCKNACRFCFTSWTHRHQTNTQQRIEQARQLCRRKKMHLMVVSNEYDAGERGGKTLDMLLTDYVKRPVKASMVRMGIEFAQEDTRKRMGKAIPGELLCHAIQKANADNLALRLFHIAGYEPVSAWDTYMDNFAKIFSQYPNNRIVHFMFNNLQYQNYTPLYDERKQINPEYYIDITKTRQWYDTLRQQSRSVLVGAPSPFQHVAARMGIELSEAREQVDFWLTKINNAAKKMTVPDAYKSLFDTGVMDCKKRRLKKSTGEIIVGERNG